MLRFEPITKYERGIVFSLLSQSWVELWNDELEAKIKRFDGEIFENPDTVGACAFISTLNGKPVGMASWDPRQGPDIGIIGYNCVLSGCQGRGFGKAQIKEILKRLEEQGFKKVIVTTGEHPFFEPADRMYLACGFKEIRRYNEGRDPRYGSIDYEIELKEDSDSMKLIEPVLELKAEFFAMVEEFKAEGDTVINGVGSIEVDDFDASVSRARSHVKGVDLPENWVPCSTFWLVCRNRIVGTVSLRHELNDFLRDYGGHIGYSIRPSQRGKGYGTQMLRLTLEKGRLLGVERALVTCDDNNIASARTIEKNGGKLADTVKTEYAEYLVRRYWFDLASDLQEK